VVMVDEGVQRLCSWIDAGSQTVTP
jgi:hypothetical protein